MSGGSSVEQKASEDSQESLVESQESKENCKKSKEQSKESTEGSKESIEMTKESNETTTEAKTAPRESKKPSRETEVTSKATKESKETKEKSRGSKKSPERPQRSSKTGSPKEREPRSKPASKESASPPAESKDIKLRFGTDVIEHLSTKHKLDITELLGDGSYSLVGKAYDRDRKETVALKVIDCRVTPATTEYLKKFLPREKVLVLTLNHPNVMKTMQVLETIPERMVFVTEYCAKGDMLGQLKKDGPYEEKQAKFIFRQLMEALTYLEANEIVHRDLKCENIFFDAHGNVKLGDFGFARVLKRGEYSQTFCGSQVYVAPEVLLAKDYTGHQTDVWSAAVILFVMVTASMPFDDTDPEAMLNKMQKHDIAFPSSPSISTKVKALIIEMLHPNPSSRPSFKQACESDWLRDTKYSFKTAQKSTIRAKSVSRDTKRDTTKSKKSPSNGPKAPTARDHKKSKDNISVKKAKPMSTRPKVATARDHKKSREATSEKEVQKHHQVGQKNCDGTGS
ncbi:unnamed protein product [Caenorhabditis auriculariae]|uniref:Protein kinase domain-containing protein n=1 Tax=Caenorhabditis auriculariae TaxID=2777116 RepID=A0A8S1HXK2_9PELO|nr:unnamed protein product [Caenorhabditis auriculariae]